MNAVAGVGAPSYTSGAHMWKGTAATLKPNPTRSIPAPRIARPTESLESELMASATRSREVDPAAP